MKNTKIFLFVLLGLLLAGCGKKEAAPDEKPLEDGTVRTERHAFLLEDERVLIADVPETWRYVFSQVNDYAYLEEFFKEQREKEQKLEAGQKWSETAVEKDYWSQPYITFAGVGEEDGNDNFFRIDIRDGVWAEDKKTIWNPDTYQREDAETKREEFTFGDGVSGTWESCVTYTGTWVEQQEEYYGYVRDAQETYSVLLKMLKKEYDAKEQTIREFVKSVSFRTSDLGAERTKKVMERDLVTVHFADEFMKFSLQLPEGLTFEKKKDSTDLVYKNVYYTVYFDEKNSIDIYMDSNRELWYLAWKYEYHLNVDDFEETVYEIPSQGYYFPNRFFAVRVNVDEKDKELNECVKRIVQSVRFE